MIALVELVLGGLLLYFGAEWFVGGASQLALSLRVPQLLVGLTVVAYGTSAPEVVVGVQAAYAGHGEVALGNVIGSNVANIGLTFAVAALIRPARVDGSLRWRELPVLLVSAALVPVVLLDGVVSRAEGASLLGAAILYTAWMVRDARAVGADARRDATVTKEAADAAGAPRARHPRRAGLLATVGLLVLLIGGKVFVVGAVSLATAFGLSPRLVGLTVVAIGTSLPELVTSVIAARRGHSDLAVGNVVGSNIFNVLLCLGAAALANPLVAPSGTTDFDIVALLVMTVVAAVFIRSDRLVTRIEGAVALALYAAFMVVTVMRG